MIRRLSSHLQYKHVALQDFRQVVHSFLGSSYHNSGLPHGSVADTIFDFDKDTYNASQNLANALSPAQRSVLIAALNEKMNLEMINDSYIEELFKSSSNADGHMTE
jgi:hypothetical protein